MASVAATANLVRQHPGAGATRQPVLSQCRQSSQRGPVHRAKSRRSDSPMPSLAGCEKNSEDEIRQINSPHLLGRLSRMPGGSASRRIRAGVIMSEGLLSDVRMRTSTPLPCLNTNDAYSQPGNSIARWFRSRHQATSSKSLLSPALLVWLARRKFSERFCSSQVTALLSNAIPCRLSLPDIPSVLFSLS
ncbi:hypothetical protein BDV96DRAFT_597336 [Lophiotrema nucula]|uniref:Uncharacterized protein n=1 Tax=Lophiotrema nucula TaxID=690887 RepID=A0A6A5ZG94_9PLEO|nr:hypothetical protein BDV96DRAFT_597336 [Lophiotrema nucula]